MTEAPGSDPLHTAMIAVGILGGLIFYGRFYVQWLASERKRRSVIPMAFWYMSAVGSVLVLAYSVYVRSPGAAFGQSFNMVVYARNLVHRWRERGELTPGRSRAIHLVAFAVVAVGVGFTAVTWLREYHANVQLPVDQATRNWLWLGVWGLGQSLFFLRFLVQWLTTEIRRKSVVPPIFWYFSIVAALLQGASFIQRADWVNAVGMAATILIYSRNIWFIRTGRDGQEEDAA